jgi:hypothetical protein
MSRNTIAVLVAVALLTALPARADAQAVPGIDPIAQNGLGDPANKYSWSMAWFKGRLYVGTGRHNTCVEIFTMDFYKVLPFPVYSEHPAPDITCTADPYDLDLRAEIWRYTPSTGVWKQVYRSPQDVPNPRAPGKLIARDIGFRGMLVYKGALYVGGVTANEYIPELSDSDPPRLLRTTDGRHFTAVPNVPTKVDSPWGLFHTVGFRAMVAYRGRMLVTLTTGLIGDGVVAEVKRPGGSAPRFRQVTPPQMRVFEMAKYDGSLFLGTGDQATGYAVYRTEATGAAPRFKPIVTAGGGRGSLMTSVVSMHVFRGRLYVGANGYASLLPQSELIRINPDESWDVVVGNMRFAPDGMPKFPLSGLPDGFGNYYTSHLWRETVADGMFYVGTLDSAWGLRLFPFLADIARSEMGFDVYASCDGRFWWRVTKDAFGEGPNNIGARTMLHTPRGTYTGSYNPNDGTRVWRDSNRSPCAGARSWPVVRGSAARSHMARAAARPTRLLVDAQQAGTVLSWDRVRGARGYRVLRARYGTLRTTLPRPARRDAFVGDAAPDVASWTGSPAVANLPFEKPYATIGTTSRPMFVDRSARRGAKYRYVVEAIGAGGVSPRSNFALIPSAQPRPTFGGVDDALDRLPPDLARDLRAQLAQARASWTRGRRRPALRALDRMLHSGRRTAARASSVADRAAQDDTSYEVFRLLRRLRYAGVAER